MTEKEPQGLVREPEQTETTATGFWRWSGAFPVAGDYLIFFGIFLLAQFVGAIAALVAGFKMPDAELINGTDEIANAAAQLEGGRFLAVAYFVAMLLTLVCLLVYRHKRRGPRAPVRCSPRGLDPVLILWGLLFVAATSVVIEPLMGILPAVPDVYGRGVWAIVTLVVMAPVFEELIFRGVLLESTRAKHGAITAWIVSSVAFAIVHLHPTVALGALIPGLLLGFLYMRTDSIWSVMILHAINNGVAYLVLVSGHAGHLLSEEVESRSLYALIYFGALVLFVGSGYMMLRAIKRLKATDKKAEQA